MTTTETSAAAAPAADGTPTMKLELMVIPVADVDRSKAFYEAAGFRLDADFVVTDDFRVVQLTPPGSECAVLFGTGVSSSAPGSAQDLHLVVLDVEEARSALVGRGVAVSDVFHETTGVFHQASTTGRLPGPDPDRGDYASFASFSDPDGNGWVLQEIKVRAPGR